MDDTVAPRAASEQSTSYPARYDHSRIRHKMNTPAPGISTAEMLTKLRFRASWPLDVGHIATIPASIRNAVILRDKHCRFPGGCFL